MYTFRFLYTDGSFNDYERIIKVEYYDALGTTTVSENDLLHHNFPLGRDIYLFAEDAKYSASGKNLKSISVFKEEH